MNKEDLLPPPTILTQMQNDCIWACGELEDLAEGKVTHKAIFNYYEPLEPDCPLIEEGKKNKPSNLERTVIELLVKQILCNHASLGLSLTKIGREFFVGLTDAKSKAVLIALDKNRKPMTTGEVSRASRVGIAAIHTILAQLHEKGQVYKREGTGMLQGECLWIFKDGGEVLIAEEPPPLVEFKVISNGNAKKKPDRVLVTRSGRLRIPTSVLSKAFAVQELVDVVFLLNEQEHDFWLVVRKAGAGEPDFRTIRVEQGKRGQPKFVVSVKALVAKMGVSQNLVCDFRVRDGMLYIRIPKLSGNHEVDNEG